MSPDVSSVVSFSLVGQTILAFFLGRREEIEEAAALWRVDADAAVLGLEDDWPPLLDAEAEVD